MSQTQPTIFSPSLAHHHFTEQKDWAYIDAWLKTHYPTQPLAFERNPETLSILLTIATANESADEAQTLLHDVEKHALLECEGIHPEEGDDMYEALESTLTRAGSNSLDILVDLSVELQILQPTTMRIAEGIIELQTSLFDLQQAHDRVKTLHSTLLAEANKIKSIAADLNTNQVYKLQESIIEEVANRQRESKALAARLPELTDKIDTLKRLHGSKETIKPDVRDISAWETRYEDTLKVVNELEAKVNSYHGLPYDVENARIDLARLRQELDTLVRRRDVLFEGLVERESPVKKRR